MSEYNIMKDVDITPYGIMRRLKVSEYDKLNDYQVILNSYEKALKIYLFNILKSQTDNVDIINRFGKELSENNICYFIWQNKFGILDKMKELLKLIMIDYDNNILPIILESVESLSRFQTYVYEFNGFYNQQKKSGNTVVDNYQQLESELNSSKGKVVTFEDMYVVVLLFKSEEEINNMTIYRFKRLFSTILKKHNDVILNIFNSQGAKIDIDNWFNKTEQSDSKWIGLGDIDFKEKSEKIV